MRCGLVCLVCIATVVSALPAASVMLRAVPSGDGQMVYINSDGAVQLGPYREAHEFVHGYSLVTTRAGHRQFIDATGAVQVDGKGLFCQLVGTCDGERYGVRFSDGSYGCADRSGAILVEGLAAEPEILESIIVGQLANKRWSIHDHSGARILSFTVYRWSMLDAQRLVYQRSRFGDSMVISLDGKHLRRIENRPVLLEFNGEMAPTWHDHQWYFVDPDGKRIGRRSFAEVGDYAMGLAAVLEDGRWGLLDKHGRWKARPQYTGLGQISEGLVAYAHTGGLWGYLNIRGTREIYHQFEQAGPFIGGVARVMQDGKEVYINRSGRVIWSEVN